ncbi:MAG: protein kinase [bacterium]|nr:protein kinase [bacterium]
MPNLSQGARFGKYRIQNRIGQGGMGIVYLAEDTVLGRCVALKVLDPDVTSREGFEHRFRDEARILASLKHPSIIQVHNLEQIDDLWVIEMDYVERGSLADAEEAGTVTVVQTVRFAHQILHALACCHESGIVHRDVKPSNILLANEDQALLTDFGLAKLMCAHQKAAMAETASSVFFLGTPRYAPPEAWEGEEPTPAWDVYSMGAVLYEAVASRPPYEGDTPFALLKRMAEQNMAPLAEVSGKVSPELSHLVQDMLSHHTAARPRNAGEVLEKMEAVPEVQQDESRGPSARVHLRPPPSPRMRVSRQTGTGARTVPLRALVAILLVLTATVALYWMVQGLNAKGSPSSYGQGPPPTTSTILFDTRDPASANTWKRHWYMGLGEQPNTWIVSASTSRDLWFLHASKTNELELAFDGFWAEYTDESALVFRHGMVTGSGRWQYGGNAMTVTLHFQSAADGHRWSRFLLLDQPERGVARSEFAHSLEAASHVQSLLYSELMPRRIPWTQSFESLFLAPAAGLVTAPFTKLSTDALQIDGELTEPVWTQAFSQEGVEIGSLSGEADGATGRLLVRYSDTGLCFGITVDDPPANPVLKFVLLDRYDIPVSHSPRRSVTVTNGEVSQATLTSGGRELPWECAWPVVVSATEDRFEAELFVPFHELGEGREAPKPGERWRVNCRVASSTSGEGPPRVHWGFEDMPQVQHGAIVGFAAAGNLSH